MSEKLEDKDKTTVQLYSKLEEKRRIREIVTIYRIVHFLIGIFFNSFLLLNDSMDLYFTPEIMHTH